MGYSQHLGRDGETVARKAMAEEYERNSVFSTNEGCCKPLVGIRASKHYLDDRPRLWEQLSNHVRLDGPRETATAENHRLKGVTAGIFSGCIQHRLDRESDASKNAGYGGARLRTQSHVGSERGGTVSYNHLFGVRKSRYRHVASVL